MTYSKTELLASVVREFPPEAGKVVKLEWIERTLLLEIHPPAKGALNYWATLGEDGEKMPHETIASAIAQARAKAATRRAA